MIAATLGPRVGLDVIIKCHRSDINDCSLANLMFQNEVNLVKYVVLMPSSTNLGNK